MIGVIGLIMIAEGSVSVEPTWSYEADDFVRSVDISSTGEYIVAGSDDDSVYFFHNDTSTPKWAYDSDGDIYSVSISSNGSLIAAASHDWNVTLHEGSSSNISTPIWNYRTGGRVDSVDISGDGEYLGAISWNNKYYFFGSDSSTPDWSFDGTGTGVVAISDNGEYLAGGDSSQTRLFQKDSSTPQWTKGGYGGIESIAISSNGGYLVSGTASNKVVLFDRNSSTPQWVFDAQNTVRSVAISSNGEYLVAGSSDSYVYFFSKDSSTPVWSYQATQTVRCVDISADGNSIIAGSWNDNIYFFNRDNSTPLWSYDTQGDILDMAISSDGRRVVVGNTAFKIFLFDTNVIPTASIDSISPSPTNIGEEITFNGSGIDPNGPITGYEWRSDLDGMLNENASFSTSTLSKGIHNITLRVRGDEGEWSNFAFNILEIYNSPDWKYSTTGQVHSVAISADGKYLVAGTWDSKVILFDRMDNTPLWNYTTGLRVFSVAISDDGSYIAAGSDDDKVYLFERDSSTPLWSYTVNGNIRSVSISADGYYIAVACNQDSKVYLFDKRSNTPIWLSTTGGDMRNIAISADGEYIVAGSNDNKVYFFDKDSSTPEWTYETGYYVTDVAISANGSYMAAGGHDNVYFFEKNSSTPKWSASIDGGLTGEYHSIGISDDGEYIVVGTLEPDNMVYLFSKNSGTPIWNYSNNDNVYSTAISADGKYIAAGTADDKFLFFERNSSFPIWTYDADDNVMEVALSNDAEYAVAGSYGNEVLLFTGQPKTSVELTSPIGRSYVPHNGSENVILYWEGSSGYTDSPEYFVYLGEQPDDMTLLGSTFQKHLVVTDLDDGVTYYWQVIVNDSLNEVSSDIELFYVFQTNQTIWDYTTGGDVWSLAISDDGNYTVAGNAVNQVYLFDSLNDTFLWRYSTGQNVQAVAISADGGYIVAGSDDNKIYLFGNDNSTPLWTYTTGGYVKAVAISANGNLITVGSHDNNVYLFDKSSNVPLWNHDIEDPIRSISISDDGGYLVVGSVDNEVFLFDKDSSTPLWSYKTGLTGASVWSVSMTSNGEYLVAGSGEGKVFYFNKGSSTPIWESLVGNGTKAVKSVEITSNGEFIAAGSDNDKVYFFSKDSSTPLWNYTTGGDVRRIDMSTDGEYIVAGEGGPSTDSVFLFQKDSSTPIETFDIQNSVSSIVMSATGDHIVVGSDESNKVYHISLLPIINDIEIDSAYLLGEEFQIECSLQSSFNNVTSFSWYIDEYLVSTLPYFSIDNLTLGEHNITIQVTDETGWSSLSYSKMIAITLIPNATINTANDSIYLFNEAINLNGEGDDADGELVAYEWSSNMEGILGTNESIEISNLRPGYHNISFRVKDDHGYWSNPDSISIYVNQEPNATIDLIYPNPAYPGTTVTFNGSGVDPDPDGQILEYQWKVDGWIASTDASFTLNNLTIGIYVIELKVKDNRNTWSSIDDVSIEILGNQQPKATIITISPNPASTNEIIILNGSGFDSDGSVVAFQWWLEDSIVASNADDTIGPLSEGMYNISFRVKDDNNTWSEKNTTTLEVIYSNQKPTASIDSISPNLTIEGSLVVLNGSGVDPDGEIIGYQWRSNLDGFLSNQKNFSTSTLSVGLHIVFFKVQDDQSNWSTEVTSSLRINILNVNNTKPTATIDNLSPSIVYQSYLVSFVGSGDDSDGSIMEYLWVSNIDGELSTQASFSNDSLSVGVHNISFKVMDDNNTWSDEVYGICNVEEIKIAIEDFSFSQPQLSIISGKQVRIDILVRNNGNAFFDGNINIAIVKSGIQLVLNESVSFSVLPQATENISINFTIEDPNNYAVYGLIGSINNDSISSAQINIKVIAEDKTSSNENESFPWIIIIGIILLLVVIVVIAIGLNKDKSESDQSKLERQRSKEERSAQKATEAKQRQEQRAERKRSKEEQRLTAASIGSTQEIRVLRAIESIRGYVRVKIGVVNDQETAIMDVSLKLVYDRDSLRLSHIEPKLTIRGDDIILGNIQPGQKKTVAAYLDPQICTSSMLKGVVHYHDARGDFKTEQIRPKPINVVCPIFFTREEANTAIVENLYNSLECQDSKIYQLPNGMKPERAFETVRAVMGREIQEVAKKVKKDPYEAEAWYYGETKIKEKRMVMRVSVLARSEAIEIFAAAPEPSFLTGLLAELSHDLQDRLKEQGQPVQQITNVTIKDSVINRSTLLFGEGEGETNIHDSVVSRSNIGEGESETLSNDRLQPPAVGDGDAKVEKKPRTRFSEPMDIVCLQLYLYNEKFNKDTGRPHIPLRYDVDDIEKTFDKVGKLKVQIRSYGEVDPDWEGAKPPRASKQQARLWDELSGMEAEELTRKADKVLERME